MKKPEKTERFVAVRARELTHAVFVPHDLPQPEYQSIVREGRGALATYGGWAGVAECGQHVKGIVAGPARGHDWDLIRDDEKCPRCEREVQRKLSAQ